MATAEHGELRKRKNKGPVELLSKSTVPSDCSNVLQAGNAHSEESKQEDTATETQKTQQREEQKKNETEKPRPTTANTYSPEFWYELKYTVVRCVLMIVIFFVLNYYFNTYVLDPMFHRGTYYQNLQKQRRINEIRSRVCPQGAIECNVDLSHLDQLNL